MKIKFRETISIQRKTKTNFRPAAAHHRRLIVQPTDPESEPESAPESSPESPEWLQAGPGGWRRRWRRLPPGTSALSAAALRPLSRNPGLGNGGSGSGRSWWPGGELHMPAVLSHLQEARHAEAPPEAGVRQGQEHGVLGVRASHQAGGPPASARAEEAPGDSHEVALQAPAEGGGGGQRRRSNGGGGPGDRARDCGSGGHDGRGRGGG